MSFGTQVSGNSPLSRQKPCERTADYRKVRLVLNLFIVFVSICLVGCGGSATDEAQRGSNERIINGVPVDPLASPQVVSINITFADGSAALCTGTVITPTQVLTAGHCFQNLPIAATINTAIGSISAATFVVHPGYRADETIGAIFNDAAILQTTQPLGVPPLGILASRPLQAGEAIGIWGFGLTETGESGTLHGGDMIVGWTTPNHIAAQFDGLANTCFGDSGGPATAPLYDEAGNVVAVGIVGITSTGSSQDCSEGEVSLFANVQDSSVLSFIQERAPEAVIF